MEPNGKGGRRLVNDGGTDGGLLARAARSHGGRVASRRFRCAASDTEQRNAERRSHLARTRGRPWPWVANFSGRTATPHWRISCWRHSNCPRARGMRRRSRAAGSSCGASGSTASTHAVSWSGRRDRGARSARPVLADFRRVWSRQAPCSTRSRRYSASLGGPRIVVRLPCPRIAPTPRPFR